MGAAEDILKRRVDAARARLASLEARYSKAARKLDTRRKIIIGALMIDAAGKDPRFAGVLDELLARIERPHDRNAFDGWRPSGSEGELKATAAYVNGLPLD
jgi:hypothetical protein